VKLMQSYCKHVGGHEADHSPPYISKAKNMWSCTSTLLCTFTTWYLVKHSDFILLYFTLLHFWIAPLLSSMLSFSFCGQRE